MNFINFTQYLNQFLTANANLINEYSHATGKGDHREESLLHILQKILPSTINISKGIIIDSHGNQTPEFDIVIYLENDTFTFLDFANRKIIPVENVIAVGEVKTKLDSAAFKKFTKDIKYLNQLKRYYKIFDNHKELVENQSPSYIYNDDGHSPESGDLTPGLEDSTEHLSIACFLFSYSSFSSMQLKKHITDEKKLPHNIIGYFSLNKFAMISVTNGWKKIANDKDNLVLFWLFYILIQRHRRIKIRKTYEILHTDLDKYFDQFIKDFATDQIRAISSNSSR
ncbi:MAG: hypothetical protein CME62_14105 [Halobacteriovoraceae bacterium]|nr:hypothetical protein [Halobacteriovoraceae bacterium]|tara:strand:+ start:3159 stop:4007 length:849 start_codon:yes stop_codon:yes gene_type:complete